MGPHYFMQGLLMLSGIITLGASLTDASWFFDSDTARRWSCNVDRKRARLYYGSLGFLMVFMAVYAFLKTRGLI